jgi:hypothetical protein
MRTYGFSEALLARIVQLVKDAQPRKEQSNFRLIEEELSDDENS